MSHPPLPPCLVGSLNMISSIGLSHYMRCDYFSLGFTHHWVIQVFNSMVIIFLTRVMFRPVSGWSVSTNDLPLWMVGPLVQALKKKKEKGDSWCGSVAYACIQIACAHVGHICTIDVLWKKGCSSSHVRRKLFWCASFCCRRLCPFPLIFLSGNDLRVQPGRSDFPFHPLLLKLHKQVHSVHASSP